MVRVMTSAKSNFSFEDETGTLASERQPAYQGAQSLPGASCIYRERMNARQVGGSGHPFIPQSRQVLCHACTPADRLQRPASHKPRP